MSVTPQAAITADIPRFARHLLFQLSNREALSAVLSELAVLVDGEKVLLGIGHSLANELQLAVPLLKPCRAPVGSLVPIPENEYALWLWIRGEEPGELVHLQHQLTTRLAPAFSLAKVVQCFKYKEGRDLTGYEDGTENPEGEAATEVAVTPNGDSFAVLQLWAHQFDRFHAMSQTEKDHSIGRALADNEELDDAPESAHVKRTAQESFSPEAFLLRRSMPWADEAQSGLAFLSFAQGFSAFEAQLARMTGVEDGIVDALFRFSQPTLTAYFWVPPMGGGWLSK